MIYWNLLIGFLKVGCFSFGGAYSAIPLIRDVVLENGWMSEDMLTYMIAVSESTPGPLMVNLATYIGSSQAGLPGAILATAAVILPAFVIILLLTTLLSRALKRPAVQAALRGLVPCVIGIILATGIYMIGGNLLTGGDRRLDWTSLLVTAGLALFYFGLPRLLKKRISPIALIVVSAVVGILVFA